MNKVKPTALQQRAMEIIKENPDMPAGKAMITAGYAENVARSPKQNLLDRSGVLNAKEKWLDILSRKGITVDKLADKQVEWIDAKKVVSAQVIVKKGTPTSQANGELPPADSKTNDFIEVPDYQTQLKAGEMLREDFGFKQQAGSSVTFNFSQKVGKQREEYGI